MPTLPPRVVWSDVKHRLVEVADADPTIPKRFTLEVAQEPDAMREQRWQDCELTWELFQAILQKVQAWLP